MRKAWTRASAGILRELEEIEEMKRRLKQRNMIYQADAKERAAARDGLAHDAYYHLPYAEWAKIRDADRTVDEKEDS